MSKCPFKIGDLVKDIEEPRLGIGEVVAIFGSWVSTRWGSLYYSHRYDWLEPAETPIERMKRRYSDKGA